MLKTSLSIFCVVSAVVLTGCVGAGIRETALPTRIDYHCANSRVLQVQRIPEKNVAVAVINDKPLVLQRMDSAAQEKYSSDGYVLYLQGERAMLEENGQVLFGPCRAGPLPKKTRDGFAPE